MRKKTQTFIFLVGLMTLLMVCVILWLVSYPNVMEKLIPFVIPVGLIIVDAVADSLIKYGPILSVSAGVSSERFLDHAARFAHKIYLVLFAFDLTVISVAFGPQARFPQTVLLERLFLPAAIIVHVVAYFHTILVLREFETGRTRSPVKALHCFYIPVSVFLAGLAYWRLVMPLP